MGGIDVTVVWNSHSKMYGVVLIRCSVGCHLGAEEGGPADSGEGWARALLRVSGGAFCSDGL